MIRKYVFDGENEIEFDDQKSVKDLISYAFEKFDYYEPMGMDIVTLFQAYHPDTTTGWFTTNTLAKCADEIKDCNALYFAYHLPNVFYFAEGGWGHHMMHLGNHPDIPHAVSFHIRFDDFDNTIVMNGKYTFNDVLRVLKNSGYIEESCNHVEVIPVGCAGKSFIISSSDPSMNNTLVEFSEIIEQYCLERISLVAGECIYHIVLRIF